MMRRVLGNTVSWLRPRRSPRSSGTRHCRDPRLHPALISTPSIALRLTWLLALLRSRATSAIGGRADVGHGSPKRPDLRVHVLYCRYSSGSSENSSSFERGSILADEVQAL